MPSSPEAAALPQTNPNLLYPHIELHPTGGDTAVPGGLHAEYINTIKPGLKADDPAPKNFVDPPLESQISPKKPLSYIDAHPGEVFLGATVAAVAVAGASLVAPYAVLGGIAVGGAALGLADLYINLER